MATNPEQVARELVTGLRGALGDRVRCAILYGSAARGEYVHGVSDVNVMVLLDDIDTATLATAAPVASKWVRSGHTPPLILEQEQWRRASDVFAIELADMQHAHVALEGEDCVMDVVIAKQDLRVQAEHELRGKLLQLQTGMLMSAAQPEAMGDLLKKALPSFTTYLRAVLRLVDKPVPRSTPDVITQGCQVLSVQPDAWLEIWHARAQLKKLRLSLQDSLVEQYHTAAERTAVYVDILREGGK